MPATTWPTDLPQTSLISGYADAIPDGRTRSASSTGIGKSRSFWPGIRTLSVQMNLSADQWQRLIDFWTNDITYGNDAFWMPDAVSDNQPLLADPVDDGGDWLLDDGGNNILASAWVLCRFGQDPPKIQTSLSSVLHTVVMAIEVLP